jgi:hypothetical protein
MAGPHCFSRAPRRPSATGFGFPFDHLLPSHVVGIISLAVLVIFVALGALAVAKFRPSISPQPRSIDMV